MASKILTPPPLASQTTLPLQTRRERRQGKLAHLPPPSSRTQREQRADKYETAKINERKSDVIRTKHDPGRKPKVVSSPHLYERRAPTTPQPKQGQIPHTTATKTQAPNTKQSKAKQIQNQLHGPHLAQSPQNSRNQRTLHSRSGSMSRRRVALRGSFGVRRRVGRVRQGRVRGLGLGGGVGGLSARGRAGSGSMG